ncbi:hypothetical protein NT239_03995 [Chitinibacter sp. SCUT-21]|uniref:hypothetical protein n=1 Tax=Chitinibacter sp. SCUT-21 TaxID=2970891 RepID=UPI0035A6A270
MCSDTVLGMQALSKLAGEPKQIVTATQHSNRNVLNVHEDCEQRTVASCAGVAARLDKAN